MTLEDRRWEVEDRRRSPQSPVVLRLWAFAFVFLAACASAAVPSTSVAPTETRPAPSATPPRPTPAPGTLTVDAARVLGTISPFVYGANHGPWAVVTFDLFDEAETAGIRYLRFPGGNWGDQHNLRASHIDQFVELARRMGAEISVSVRLKGGTPEAAAELVRYANIEKGYGIRHWSIGNEPIYYARRDGLDYSPERLASEWRTFAEAMRAVDPAIVLVGPDMDQVVGDPGTNPVVAEGREWFREFLRVNGDLVDLVSIHYYPFPDSRVDPSPTTDDLRADAPKWDARIEDVRALIREAAGRDLPLALTEVNSNWSNAMGGVATPDSAYNAVWWADVLGRLIRQRLDAVAYFSLQSNVSTGAYGLLARDEVRPTYYVYRLYRQFGDELLESFSDDPDVSVTAALRDDGALTLMVVNLGPEARTKPLTIHGFTPSGPAEVWRLDADHLAEAVAPVDLMGGAPITIPAQSVSLFVIR